MELLAKLEWVNRPVTRLRGPDYRRLRRAILARAGLTTEAARRAVRRVRSCEDTDGRCGQENPVGPFCWQSLPRELAGTPGPRCASRPRIWIRHSTERRPEFRADWRDVADLRYEARGLVVTIRRSKTDQGGEGREIGVPFVANGRLCAATHVRKWLDAANIAEGPVFRTFNGGKKLTTNRIAPIDVARLVKRVTLAAGIEGDFAAHSLRAGFIRGHERIRIAEHVKRLGPHEVASESSFRDVSHACPRPAGSSAIPIASVRKGPMNPDSSVSIKCGFDPILTLFRVDPYIRIGYTLVRQLSVSRNVSTDLRCRAPIKQFEHDLAMKSSTAADDVEFVYILHHATENRIKIGRSVSPLARSRMKSTMVGRCKWPSNPV
jgi:hypothetical protein